MPAVTDTEILDEELALDSLTTAFGADSVIVLPDGFAQTDAGFDATLDTLRLQAYLRADSTRMTQADTLQATVALPPAWEQGLEPVERASHAGNRTSFLAVIAIIFIVMAYNFRHLRRLVGVYAEELWTIRHGRDNVFDDRPAADVRILIMLIIQFVVCGGILLSGGIRLAGGDPSAPMAVGRVAWTIGVVAAYYVFEIAAYQTVGYTFTTSEGRREWLRGFNSSQALLGLALAIPAVLSVFYPRTLTWMVAAGAVMYFFARILFILKGFRIFYDKISGLLYFILYLCTLEIIPLLMVYKCSILELV